MTLPHRIAYERWRAAALPPSLEEQFVLDSLVYGTACARVDATGRIERVHPLEFVVVRKAGKTQANHDWFRLVCARRLRNARKRQRRARMGK